MPSSWSKLNQSHISVSCGHPIKTSSLFSNTTFQSRPFPALSRLHIHHSKGIHIPGHVHLWFTLSDPLRFGDRAQWPRRALARTGRDLLGLYIPGTEPLLGMPFPFRIISRGRPSPDVGQPQWDGGGALQVPSCHGTVPRHGYHSGLRSLVLFAILQHSGIG